MMEEWRRVCSVPNVEDSNHGRIRVNGKLAKQFPQRSRDPTRPYFNVYVGGPDRRHGLVHRLVCEAFHGPCPEGMQCAHSDGDHSNNKPDNLRWATPLQNQADCVTHGTRQFGARVNTAKLDDRTALLVYRRARAGEAHLLIAAEFGISTAQVSCIRIGRNRSHVTGQAFVPRRNGRLREEIRRARATGALGAIDRHNEAAAESER